MLLHVGDIAYADDAFLHTPLKFEYEDVYNQYEDDMEPITSTVPYMTAPGNHESECHSPACLVDSGRRKQLSNFTAYNARHHMPSESSGGVASMWYSFDYGPIREWRCVAGRKGDPPPSPTCPFDPRH